MRPLDPAEVVRGQFSDYRQQEGARFSLKRFHDEMLRHGAPPIRLLREVMLIDPAKWPTTL